MSGKGIRDHCGMEIFSDIAELWPPRGR